MPEPRTAADIVNRLPTPEQAFRDRLRDRGFGLPKGPTRLDAKEAKDKIDEKELDAWRTKVYTRDRYRCRVCKRKVSRSIELKPDQAHGHHIVSRKFKPLRYDRRNGVTCCPRCHEDIERNRVVIIGKAADMFVLDGKSYLNGDCLTLEFIRK